MENASNMSIVQIQFAAQRIKCSTNAGPVVNRRAAIQQQQTILAPKNVFVDVTVSLERSEISMMNAFNLRNVQ